MRITELSPTERYRYLTQNRKICPSCNKEKRYTRFVHKEREVLMEVCYNCYTEKEIRKIILEMLEKK